MDIAAASIVLHSFCGLRCPGYRMRWPASAWLMSMTISPYFGAFRFATGCPASGNNHAQIVPTGE